MIRLSVYEEEEIQAVIKKHLPSSCVTAIDISGRALDVARRNATKHEEEVTFLSVDILNETMLKKCFSP